METLPKVHYIDVEGHLELLEEDENGNRWSKKMTEDEYWKQRNQVSEYENQVKKMTEDEYWKQRNQVSEYENQVLGITPSNLDVITGLEAEDQLIAQIKALKEGRLLPRVRFETHVNKDGTFQKVYDPR
jgi:hypothetical protein